MTALKKYTDLRSWLRHLLRGSVHAGTAAVLGALGLNSAEGLAPDLLHDVSVDWRQLLGFFVSAAVVEALRRINSATADTNPPIPP